MKNKRKGGPGRPRKAPGAPVKSRLQSCITTGGGGGQQFKDTKKTPALRADANPYATPDPAKVVFEPNHIHDHFTMMKHGTNQRTTQKTPSTGNIT